MATMPFNNKTNNMKLLSLFNGMSCSKMAFDELNIPISKFYVSEIDKYANKLTSYLYPEAIHLGSVVDVDVTRLDKIDFIAAGSPCQSFSFAGKRKGMATKCEEEILSLEKYLELKSQGFEFEGQSYLFWEFIRIYQDCKKINPEVKFLLENVEMGEKWEKVLSKAVGYNGIHINSALVSAQNRKRIYWINFGLEPRGLFNDLESIVQQPKDKGILLKDILESEVDEKYFLSEKRIKYFERKIKKGFLKQICNDIEGKSECLLATMYKQMQGFCVASRGRNIDNPKNRTSGLETEQQLEVRLDGKSNTLTSVLKDNLTINKSSIRAYTPKECLRLQTIPEHLIEKILTSGTSDTQIYKMAGNGWTVKVIAHLLQYLDFTN
jgi:DNA-cytosine methyltransferase